jgi:hypothetical protein
MGAGIDQNLAVPAHEIARADHVEDAWPAMRVQRNGVAGRDAGFQHAHLLVFEQKPMMIGSGNQCVEGIGPRPRLPRRAPARNVGCHQTSFAKRNRCPLSHAAKRGVGAPSANPRAHRPLPPAPFSTMTGRARSRGHPECRNLLPAHRREKLFLLEND